MRGVDALRNGCEKSGRRQNWNSLEWVENQQILVARHKAIGTTNDSDLQQLVVVGIATDLHQTRQFDLCGAETQVGHERPASRIIDVLIEFRPRQPRFQFFEQLPRDDQGRIVEHPAKTGEGCRAGREPR